MPAPPSVGFLQSELDPSPIHQAPPAKPRSVVAGIRDGGLEGCPLVSHGRQVVLRLCPQDWGAPCSRDAGGAIPHAASSASDRGADQRWLGLSRWSVSGSRGEEG